MRGPIFTVRAHAKKFILLSSFVSLIFAIFFELRSRTILYYDELFDIQPIRALAEGCNSLMQFHTTLIFHCFPVSATNQYQGTIRGFLFFPLIKLKILSSETFVAVNSILFVCTIIVFYLMVRSLTSNRVVPSLVTGLLALQPVVWTQFAFDLGPVSTQILLRSILLFSVLNDLRTSKICGKLTLFLSGLLIWGKLDGLWFVAGLIFGQLAVLGWKTYIRKFNLKSSLLILGFMGAGIYAFKVSQNQYATGIALDFNDKFLSQLPNDLINGISNLVIPSGTNNLKILSFPFLLLFLVSLIGPFIPPVFKESVTYRFFLFLRIQNIVIVVFYLITPRSTAPWHTVSFFPSSVALIATWVVLLNSREKIKSESVIYKNVSDKFLIPAIIFCIFAGGLVTYRDYSTMNRGNLNPLFSKELAQAFNEIPVGNKENSKLLFTSWGLYNPIVMDNSFKSSFKFAKIIDAWPWFEGEIDENKINFFRWNLESGPLSKVSSFTLVEINPSNSGARRKSLNYAEDVMHLCQVSQIAIPIKRSTSSLNVVTGNRC